MALIRRFAFRVPVEDAPNETAEAEAGGSGFVPLSVLWTYSSPKDLAPHVDGRGEATAPTEIRIRCLECSVQWISGRGTPGTAKGDFEQINGHVRLVCPGCSAEGGIEVSRLMGGDAHETGR